MAKRPVYWYEGMFLKPHHFQAADRYLRERLRESEDWLHPHDWGIRSVTLDEAAITNHSVVLRACQARFKDGTTINIPEETTVDPIDAVVLRKAMTGKSDLVVYLAIPARSASKWQADETDGKRSYSLECVDENTGSDDEPIEFRRVQARLLLSNVDVKGYEVLPLARIGTSASADEGSSTPTLGEAKPRYIKTYVPPILGLDAWTWLHDEVRDLHQQMGTWIEQEAGLLVGRKIAFDSQVLGDAERILRLSTLNTASAAFKSFIHTSGVHPLDMYRELCRLMGQLSIFSETRKPIEVDGYDHENIGPIYIKVIREIRRLLGEPGKVAFKKRYFQLEGRWFQAHLEPEWTLGTTKMYIGVETTELNDAECDELMRMTDWKLGSGEQVEEIFQKGAIGLGMKPLNRIPPALPAGVVYFEIERSPDFWKDVVRTQTLGLRFKLERGKFISKQMLALTSPRTQRSVNLQFAVYVVNPSPNAGGA